MKINDGGPAFPLNRTVGPTDRPVGDARAYGTVEEGMSLRDWFAGQALPAIIARIPLTKIDNGSMVLPELSEHTEDEAAEIRNAVGILAYQYADAMLAARNQPTP